MAKFLTFMTKNKYNELINVVIPAESILSIKELLEFDEGVDFNFNSCVRYFAYNNKKRRYIATNIFACEEAWRLAKRLNGEEEYHED